MVPTSAITPVWWRNALASRLNLSLRTPDRLTRDGSASSFTHRNRTEAPGRLLASSNAGGDLPLTAVCSSTAKVRTTRCVLSGGRTFVTYGEVSRWRGLAHERPLPAMAVPRGSSACYRHFWAVAAHGPIPFWGRIPRKIGDVSSRWTEEPNFPDLPESRLGIPSPLARKVGGIPAPFDLSSSCSPEWLRLNAHLPLAGHV